MPWYKRDVDRGQANKLLIKDGRDGTFLVRPSQKRFENSFLFISEYDPGRGPSNGPLAETFSCELETI